MDKANQKEETLKSDLAKEREEKASLQEAVDKANQKEQETKKAVKEAGEKTAPCTAWDYLEAR